MSLWLARELALVDAVVVLDNASDEIKATIRAYDELRLLRVQPSETGAFMTSAGDSLFLGSAVDPSAAEMHTLRRANPPGVAVLAWDAELASLATQAWHRIALTHAATRRLSLGSLSLDGWDPITELDLASVLAGIDIAVVIAGLHPAGPALSVRSLLPWSFGVRTITVVANHVEPEEELPGPIVMLDGLSECIAAQADTVWPDLARWSADAQAASLISAIDRSQAAFRTARS